MALNINGRMKVKTLRADFKKEFGLMLRVYDGRSFADDDSTLASIRKGDSKGGEFAPRKNTKVGNLEDKIMEMFGIKTQVAGSDDSYLCDNDLTLAKAKETDDAKMGRKENKASKTSSEEESLTRTSGALNLLEGAAGEFIAQFNAEIAVMRDIASVTPAELEKLAGGEDGFVRQQVAKNLNTPVSILEKLAGDEDEYVISYVVGNPNTPVSVLEKLAEDASEDVRKVVAENSNTPGSLLEKLAEDASEDVRSSVAGNPNTPVSVLEKLAEDEDVRSSVAGNPNTPVSVLEKLAEDEDVRSSVAGNPNTPVPVLEKLAEDASKDLRKVVAGNSNTPGSVLEKLAEDEDEDVREAVARNSNTPGSVLEKLAEDGDEDVRSSVAGNSNTLVSAFEKLAEDEDVGVREIEAENPHTPSFVLEKLAEDESEYVRLAVADRSNTPVSVLEKLAEDEDEVVRTNVARNPNTPGSVLEKLAEDEDEDVREAVAENANTSATLAITSEPGIFSEYENRRNVVGVAVGRLFASHIEELIDGEIIEEAHASSEVYELAGKAIDAFIGELESKWKNILEDKMLLELGGNLKEYTSSTISSEKPSIEDYDYWYEVNLFFVITKELPADVLNAFFLDMKDCTFQAAFESDYEGEIIRQCYECGEYESGYFSPIGGAPRSDYVNTLEIPLIKSYLEAVKKLIR